MPEPCGRLRWCVVLAALASGCGSSAPPAPTLPPVVTLVAGPPSRYPSIAVVRDGRAVTVPPAIRSQVAPLLVARLFTAGGGLAAYGLVPPQADLEYRTAGGATIDVQLGTPTFDHHFVYARRADRPGVALVAATVADPLLVLVGVTVPPPS